MNFSSAKFTLSGPKGRNDDDFLEPISKGGTIWVAVADGVGSSKNGGLAAHTCVDVIREKATEEPDMELLFRQCSEALRRLSNDEVSLGKLSTTLTVVALRGARATVGHTGDSRVTHFRGGGVMGRTKDQTEVQRLLDDGALSPRQAQRYPRRNVLMSSMSSEGDYELFRSEFSVEAGDRILLSSDGFHSKIPRKEMAGISQSTDTISDFLDQLRTMVSERGLDDDATVVGLEVMKS
ncbi:MAG: PP2C family serine/threonine-protein phosphatase [Pseudomonadota bacterium]